MMNIPEVEKRLDTLVTRVIREDGLCCRSAILRYMREMPPAQVEIKMLCDHHEGHIFPVEYFDPINGELTDDVLIQRIRAGIKGNRPT